MIRPRHDLTPADLDALGFETVAEIPDKPPGHTEFVLRLTLDC